MKRSHFNRISIIGALFLLPFVLNSCSTSFGNSAEPPNDVLILRFVDPELKNNILVSILTDEDFKGGKPIVPGSNRYIGYYTRMRHGNEPVYIERSEGYPEWSYSYYDVCELAADSVWIELHDGWFCPNPVKNMFGGDCRSLAIDAKWEDLCEPDINLDSVEILGRPYNDAYMYNIPASVIAKLQKKKETQLTTKDIVEGLNQIIDENKIKEYGNKCTLFCE